MNKLNLQRQALGAVGKDVLDEFSALSSGITEEYRAKVVNEMQRFEIWASSLGLYHTGHSSLDYRFRDSPPLFHYAQRLLHDLEETIKIRKSWHLGQLESEERDIMTLSDASSEEEDLSSYPLEDVTMEYLSNITIAVDRLYALSFKIRNPGLRSGLTRATAYKQVDPETGIDLINCLADWDLRYMVDIFRTWWPDTDLMDIEDHFLVRRLARANTHRRQQFKYWQRRNAKYWKFHRAGLQEGALRSQMGNLNMTFALEGSEHGQLSDPTTATLIGPTVLADFDKESAATQESYVLRGDESDDTNFFPAPPDIDQDKSEFECPYCFILCSRKLLEPRAWRRHLIKDLRPYVCTFEECKDTSQQYETRPEWMAHEYSVHGHQPQSPRKCPCCLAENVTPEHVASHLRRVACFSLPRLGVDCSSDDHGTGENIAVGQSESEGHSNASSDIDEWAETVKTISLAVNENTGLRTIKAQVRPNDATEPLLAHHVRLMLQLGDETEFEFKDNNGRTIPVTYDSLYNGMEINVHRLVSTTGGARSLGTEMRGERGTTANLQGVKGAGTAVESQNTTQIASADHHGDERDQEEPKQDLQRTTTLPTEETKKVNPALWAGTDASAKDKTHLTSSSPSSDGIAARNPATPMLSPEPNANFEQTTNPTESHISEKEEAESSSASFLDPLLAPSSGAVPVQKSTGDGHMPIHTAGPNQQDMEDIRPASLPHTPIIRFDMPREESSSPVFHFSPISRTLPSTTGTILVGRFSEKEGRFDDNRSQASDAPVGFKSKVVSRKHCEFDFGDGGWMIRDLGSSSGTFLNGTRLSLPNVASKMYNLENGDIVQLGIDFRGGVESFYRCVRIRIEFD
ncbi:hypothetical protein BJX64DRAFT_289828 [Aspergillus heterothallicus]